VKFISSLILLLSILFAAPANAGKYGDWYGEEEPGTIIIITGDHTLHYIDDWGHRISYPIAVGKEGMQWYGETSIIGKKKDPDWRPTPAMRKRDPKLPEMVKGGPGNPLGSRAIYLGEGYLRIHGTNTPSSIGKDASSGCFRLYKEDIEELFSMVKVGSKVIVTP
jgi:lipoprotein-anchoring transpeptidase ErfK/SrfK